MFWGYLWLWALLGANAVSGLVGVVVGWDKIGGGLHETRVGCMQEKPQTHTQSQNYLLIHEW